MSNTFNSKESLASHREYCNSYEAIKIELLEEESKISFKNYNRSMPVPFIVYPDLESFTPQLSKCQPNSEKSYTMQYQKHIPSGFYYHIKCFADTLYSHQTVTFVKVFNGDMLRKYLWTHLKRTSKTFAKSLSSQKV